MASMKNSKAYVFNGILLFIIWFVSVLSLSMGSVYSLPSVFKVTFHKLRQTL